MRVHSMKADPEPFHAVWMGLKTFEVRKDDRGGFAAGDVLMLREHTPVESHAEHKLGEGGFTGAKMLATVLYVLPGGSYGLPPGLCVLAIRIDRRSSGDPAANF